MEMLPVSEHENFGTSKRQLGQLNEEVQRLTAKLARLSISSATSPFLKTTGVNLPVPSRRLVEDLIRLRGRRSELFEGDLFSDPPWDILVALLHGELSGGRLSIGDLAKATGIAQTTVMRWLATLADQRLIVRRPDHYDSRRVYIELTITSRDALYRFFAEMTVMLAAWEDGPA